MSQRDGSNGRPVTPYFAPSSASRVDPEAILFVRPFDRHAELLGENAGAAAMVDMAVGQQDLLDRHARLLRRRP